LSPVADSAPQEVASHRSFVSDVFHKLSQPLTALHCSLELSLARDETTEEYRASVEAALENAERLRQSLLLMRELSDADDPGNISLPVALHKLLLDLREDLLPVFESAGVDLDVTCDAVQVRGNEANLTRAFFYLLEYLQRTSPRSSLNVYVQQKNRQQVEIRITLFSAVPAADSGADLCDPASAGALEIARRTFRAVGGDLVLVESAAEQSVWIATLPLAP
jgi:signal transduction histidine kinase